MIKKQLNSDHILRCIYFDIILRQSVTICIQPDHLREPTLQVSYGITFLAGILLGSLLDALYLQHWRPGRLIFYLHQLFLGPYQEFWRIHVTVLLIPLIVVNGITYFLYRRSQFHVEKVFFLILSTFLNGFIFFAAGNILMLYFI